MGKPQTSTLAGEENGSLPSVLAPSALARLVVDPAHGPGFSPSANPKWANPHDSLVSVLRGHAKERPEKAAYINLADGTQAETTLTYGEFDLRARAIAAKLQGLGLSGQRVMLAYPPGLDFITGFFGCLYAGATAVPTFMPHRKRTLDRFRAISDDANAGYVLSTREAINQLHGRSGRDGVIEGGASAAQWLAADEIESEMAEGWAHPTILPSTLAMLQYTSGSTSRPKGVMLSHENLAYNAWEINRAFDVRESGEAGVCWLPSYHDMGLVGGVLAPVIAGRPHVMMSPAAFLQSPISWLKAITKYRVTISGGPNFAYDLCVRKVTEEQRAELDLSCWNLAYVGAEPIMPETLDRFSETFARCGFKREAFYPCYGMAEATLMVTGSKRFFGPVIRAFDERELSLGRGVAVTEGGRRLVSSGAAVGGLEVAVVEPESLVECPEGKVGEVWVSGPSVGQGYWENPGQSKKTFGVQIAGRGMNGMKEGMYLRTGDLGFYAEGQLYITGRMDDLMIVRGVNHHPQDIEATARNSHPLLETGVGAAFLVDDAKGGQCVVLVHEINRVGTDDLSPVLDAVRAGVLDGHGLALGALLLVRMGAVPRTTSGKVQRKGCKAAYLAGEIKAAGQYVSAAGDCGSEAAVSAQAPDASVSFVVAVICQHAHTMAGVPVGSINAQTELASLGLDSLKRMELLAVLEKTFAGHLPDSEIAQAITVGDLAKSVQRHLIDRPKDGTLTREVPPQHYEIAQFPEYAQLKRQEAMLRSVAGENPYFRVDQGNAPAGMANIQGRELVNFCVYDYLGMAYDKHVAAGATEAIARYGVSAGASRLVAGQKQVHQDLEEGLAEFLGTAGAITFVSGHATNVTAIGHLLSPGDLIAHDMLAHNSIIQGAKLSGATARAFTHNDWQALDAFLEHERHRYRRVLIAIEGVYSMDGDWPDLPRFIELKKKYKTLLLVDEAHSLGTMGATGRGIGEHFGVDRKDVDLWMGTLSKSLASCGGYIAGSAELVEYFRYTAPGFIYSVGLSPPVAAAALAALEVLKAQPERVARLRTLSSLFLSCAKAAGLDTGLASGSPVVPVIVGNSVKCVKLSQALFDRGINVQPILYPAVSEAAARLRFFITTNHSEAQVREAVRAAAEELGRL